jgi:hypothetical protein
MALNTSQVSRNLLLKVTLFGLELEDLLMLMLGVCGSMILGNVCFSDRYIFHIPMNYFLPLLVLVAGIPGVMLLKYGKPRGYLVDLVAYYSRPTQYSARTPEQSLKTTYFREEE